MARWQALVWLCAAAVAAAAAAPRNVTVTDNDKYVVANGDAPQVTDVELGNRAGVLGQAAQAVGNAFVAKGKCIVCVAVVLDIMHSLHPTPCSFIYTLA
ncbi:hypothetical protein FOCC_FOCC003608 [Frankliniella occidentalis]|nr:hypothetical protein FOCC_FOCC003608 [Frankliniella occidentalis]